MKLIDSHVHFWELGNLTYDWVIGSEVLERSYLPKDYKAFNGEHEVEAIVFVEAGADGAHNIAEVEWIETLDAPIKAIVAHAPLENPEGREATLETLAGHPLVKSIRRIYQSEADGFARQTSFIEGVQSLKNYGLSFDICIKSHQLQETIDLVKQVPDGHFILDHIAKPNIAGGEFDRWAKKLKELASFENVDCKISGVITEADHEDWTIEQIKPYILATIEAFGIDRVMFGSDWPVVRLAGSFVRWVDTLNYAIADLSDDEKQKLFLDNAIRSYRMEI